MYCFTRFGVINRLQLFCICVNFEYKDFSLVIINKLYKLVTLLASDKLKKREGRRKQDSKVFLYKRHKNLFFWDMIRFISSLFS